MENGKNRMLFGLSTLAIITGCYAATIGLAGEPGSPYGYAALLAGLSAISYGVFAALAAIIRKVGVAGVKRLRGPMLALAGIMVVTAAFGIAGALAMAPKAGAIAATVSYLNAAAAAYAAQAVLYG
jgi:hypothetical protein